MVKDFLSRLFGGSQKPSHLYGIYVQCDHCSEIIRTYINLHSDLSIQYGDTDKDNTYVVHKQLLGSGTCFQRVDVQMTFDSRRKLINRQISGGQFVSEEEYQEGNSED